VSARLKPHVVVIGNPQPMLEPDARRNSGP